MRGNPIGSRIPNSISNAGNLRAFVLSSSPFSTSSNSSGRGRGRGGGSSTQFDFVARAPGKPASYEPETDSPEPPLNGTGRGGGSSSASRQFDFVARAPGKPDSTEPKTESPSGIGHGRGRPGPSNPALPAFSSIISSLKTSKPGMGRGRDNIPHEPSRPNESQQESVPPKLGEPSLPSSIHSTLSGFGRGKADKPVTPSPSPQVKEENRHIRARAMLEAGEEKASVPMKPKITREEAVRRAVSILSRGDSQREGAQEGLSRGRGGGRGRGRGRGRDRWEPRERMEDTEEGFATGLYLGDNADGEKLANRVGPENMSKLIEEFEEMGERVLPSPMQDAYLDALHTNYMIEFEPEYLMGEFDQNPDIDEKPPLPLRDVLEKVKPFIMAYEGIRSQEEWEEVVEETMKKVPLLKEIVDYYSGPDRVTAKKQQEELERVAKTLPASAPASVKQFTDRAVLSLQSNPGWGFDKKYQFMDKLVREFASGTTTKGRNSQQ